MRNYDMAEGAIEKNSRQCGGRVAFLVSAHVRKFMLIKLTKFTVALSCIKRFWHQKERKVLFIEYFKINFCMHPSRFNCKKFKRSVGK
jgi:hypothetical protein